MDINDIKWVKQTNYNAKWHKVKKVSVNNISKTEFFNTVCNKTFHARNIGDKPGITSYFLEGLQDKPVLNDSICKKCLKKEEKNGH